MFGDGNGGDHRDLYLPFNDAPFSQPEQLYDLEQNPTEWRNVIKARPEVVAQMTTLMEQIRSAEDATLTGNAKLRALQIAGVNIGTFNQDVLNYAATVDPSIENVRGHGVSNSYGCPCGHYDTRRPALIREVTHTVGTRTGRPTLSCPRVEPQSRLPSPLQTRARLRTTQCQSGASACPLSAARRWWARH